MIRKVRISHTRPSIPNTSMSPIDVIVVSRTIKRLGRRQTYWKQEIPIYPSFLVSNTSHNTQTATAAYHLHETFFQNPAQTLAYFRVSLFPKFLCPKLWSIIETLEAVPDARLSCMCVCRKNPASGKAGNYTQRRRLALPGAIAPNKTSKPKRVDNLNRCICCCCCCQ